MNVSLLPKEAAPDQNADVDPLRAALAVAIKDARKVRDAFERHRLGVERTFQAVIAAEAALEKATAGVAKAQEAHVAAIAHAASAGTATPRSKVPAARQAAADAADELEAQKAALTQMRNDLPNWGREVAAADVQAEAAISAIFAPLAENLIERGEKILAKLTPIRNALATLRGEASPLGHDAALAFEDARKPLVFTMEMVSAFLTNSRAIERVQLDLWAEARALLRTDAYSPLPEGLGILFSDKPNEL